MRILIDTNVLIPLEPTSPDDVEGGTEIAAELVGLAQGVHTILIHPESLTELARDLDVRRRQTRAALMLKYRVLEHAPAVDATMQAVIGESAPGSHDEVDDLLLAAVSRDAVDLLITDDTRIHRKATRLGVGDRVLTVRDGADVLRALLSEPPPPPPLVVNQPAYALNERDPIFDSFREDYDGFDDWLGRAKRAARPSWVIEGGDREYAGLCIVKQGDDELRVGGHVLKVCSLKVADAYQGSKYGELLLKTLFAFCNEGSYDATWITVYPRHLGLIALLEGFGFHRHSTNDRGELCYVKRFTWTREEYQSMGALDFHVAFGPPALKVDPGDTFVVPIRPRYHELLFPEVGQQMLPIEPRPFGNAIRKAYLCNAGIRRLERGSCILFYRSQDVQAVTCVGIVESVIASSDPREVAIHVGQRTVYRYAEIERMCEREVLAILFRFDRMLTSPIRLADLVDKGVIRGAPQAIAAIHGEAAEWLIDRLQA